MSKFLTRKEGGTKREKGLKKRKESDFSNCIVRGRELLVSRYHRDGARVAARRSGDRRSGRLLSDRVDEIHVVSVVVWSKLPLSSNIVTPGRSATVCRTDGHDNARYVNDRDIVVIVHVTYPSRPLPRLLFNKGKVWKISSLCNRRFNFFFKNFSLRVLIQSPRFLFNKKKSSKLFLLVRVGGNKKVESVRNFCFVCLSILDLFIYILGLLLFVSRLVFFVYLFRFRCLKTCLFFRLFIHYKTQ